MKDMKRLYKKHSKKFVQCGTRRISITPILRTDKSDCYEYVPVFKWKPRTDVPNISLKGFIRLNIKSLMRGNGLLIDSFSQKIQKICEYV